MTGVVETLMLTYGFIRSTDGVSHFFMPSAMMRGDSHSFSNLSEGDEVEFTHLDHPRGARAIEVRATGGTRAD